MVDINLLPKEFQKQSASSPWHYGSIAAPFVAIGVLAFMYIPLASQTAGAQKKISELNGNIAALEAQKQQYDALMNTQSELEKVTTVAQTMRDKKTYWSNDLAMFSTRIPNTKGVAIKSMRMSTPQKSAIETAQSNGIFVGKDIRRQLDIAGTAASQQSVIEFLNTFENNPNFGVDFKGMQRDQQSGEYNFTAIVGVVAPADANKPTSPTPTPETQNSSAPPAAPTAPAAPPSGGNQ